jgi:hypothetical protein
MNKPPPYIREVTTFEIIPENLKAWRNYYDITITEAGDRISGYAAIECGLMKATPYFLDRIDYMFNEAERRRREKGI